jgi:hypothetical protein
MYLQVSFMYRKPSWDLMIPLYQHSGYLKTAMANSHLLDRQAACHVLLVDTVPIPLHSWLHMYILKLALELKISQKCYILWPMLKAMSYAGKT